MSDRGRSVDMRSSVMQLVVALLSMLACIGGSRTALACPNAELRVQVQLALQEARTQKDEDRDALQRIRGVLTRAARLGTVGESVCLRRELDVRREAESELARIDGVLNRSELTLEQDLAPGVEGSEIEQIQLDGDVVTPGSTITPRNGRRHALLITHRAATPDRRLVLALELGGRRINAKYKSDTTTSFTFDTPPGAAKLVLKAEAKVLAAPMFLVASIGAANENVRAAQSSGSIALRLNGSPVSPGTHNQLPAGTSELTVQHPPTGGERWYHIRASIDGKDLEGIDEKPGQETYSFAGVEGQTRNIELAIDSDTWPNPLRPWMLWGGAGLAIVGTGVGVWQYFDGRSEDRQAQRQIEENCPCNRAETTAAGIVESWDRRDAAWTRSTLAFVFGGIGLGAMAVGLWALEPGRPYPREATAKTRRAGGGFLRVRPSLQPGTYAASVWGVW